MKKHKNLLVVFLMIALLGIAGCSSVKQQLPEDQAMKDQEKLEKQLGEFKKSAKEAKR